MIRRGSIMRAVLVAVALGLAGCATETARPNLTSQASLEMAALAERDRRLTSLQSSAIMEYTAPNGHLKARERITIRRPASLRVEALSPLGVALVVAADANQVAIYDPSKDTIARGAATADTLNRVAQIPLAPEPAVRLLLGLPPTDSLISGSAVPTTADNGMSQLSYTQADGTVDRIAFDNGNLARLSETASSGKLIYQVSYSDYRDIGGLQFPHTIEASFPATATAINLRYEDPTIDSVIPDSTFVLSPGPQTRELRLGLNFGPDPAQG
jgi:outer membrane lipoprotein-sorting protein